MAVKTLTWNLELIAKLLQLYYNGGCYHIETSPLICLANQWTGSYMITDSVMKELKRLGLFNLISFQLDVLLTGNIMQIYNLDRCEYY